MSANYDETFPASTFEVQLYDKRFGYWPTNRSKEIPREVHKAFKETVAIALHIEVTISPYFATHAPSPIMPLILQLWVPTARSRHIVSAGCKCWWRSGVSSNPRDVHGRFYNWKNYSQELCQEVG